MCVDVLMPNLNIIVVSEGKHEKSVEIPLVLESECPELPFPPTFTVVSKFLLLLSSVNFPHLLVILPLLVQRGAIQYDSTVLLF